jgi:hypothetical protein
MKTIVSALAGLLVTASALPAQQPATKTVPSGTPVTITVVPATPSAPGVTITLRERHGHATPHRHGCNHTGGGNIDIAQPSPDTVIVTMMGAAVAAGHPACHSSAGFDFDLEQCFEVTFEKSDVKAAKLTIEGRVIGLLRGGHVCHKGGSAEQGQACATVTCGADALVSLCVPPHAVAGCEDLSVNCHAGPLSVPLRPGKYTLHQVFHIGATYPPVLLLVPTRAASAEFAPDPAVDPLWINYFEPFHGAIKKDFGFQVILKVAQEEEKKDEKKDEAKNGASAAPKGEKLPPPQS